MAEVTDFVDFLHSREKDRDLTQSAAQAAVASFAAARDNDAVAMYDKSLQPV